MTAVLERGLVRAADRLEGRGDDARREDGYREKRARLLAQCPTPAHLAARFDKGYVRTEAVDLVATELVDAMVTYDGKLVVSVPPQEMKALDVSTPILTTAGWTTMGDIRPGAEVFHPDGHTAKVVGVSDVKTGHTCYRVTTTDGRSVVADAGHLWTVQDRRRQRSTGPRHARVRSVEWETLTTQQLVDRGVQKGSWTRADGTQGRSFAFLLPQQRAIVSKPVELPIEPYLFGAWLGDGSSSAAQLTVGDDDLEHMRDQVELAGATVVSTHRRRTAWTVRFNTGGMRDGFEARCRRLGVWGNKHIPDLFLTAGTEQRLALLQGLMDTDGTIATNGTTYRASFTTTRQELGESVLYLARSLGWRATIHENAAMLDGREVGRKWVVAFTPQQGEPAPFRLARKAAVVQAPKSRAGERHAVSIAAIEPVESRPVRCIKVDREDGLFLAGRDLIVTHNTTLLRWLGFWLLLHDPDRRVVYASYAASLARATGRAVRTLVQTHGGHYGLEVDYGHADASDWELARHRGGMVTTGVGGALTGRPADVMIVDDPLRNQQDADSVTIRENVHEWWSSVALTRMAPGAPAVVVQTRWHEDDLAGRRLAEGWRWINIPALADGKTEDALGREPGTWLVSARGRTPQDWDTKRKAVGERTFAALYQGRPAPLEGGVFKRAWFDLWRVDEVPAGCLPPVVVVDPADNPGSGDEAGIVVGCAHPAAGKGYLLDDLSGAMTVGRWARLALLTCVRRHAPTLAFEQSLSQLPTRIREAWQHLHQQALALRKAGGDVDAAVARLSRADDSAEVTERIRGELAEIVADFDSILGFGQTGPRIKRITAKGTKQARMLLVAPTFETGRMVLVGRHGVFEHQAATWQEGQDSPDRVDAGVHLAALLLGVSGVATLSRADERVPTSSTGLRRGGGAARIARSTGR